jgi:hypothetical protein
MRFYIRAKDQSVGIDDSAIVGIDCSSIASNVNVVQWYGGGANPVGQVFATAERSPKRADWPAGTPIQNDSGPPQGPAGASGAT